MPKSSYPEGRIRRPDQPAQIRSMIATLMTIVMTSGCMSRAVLNRAQPSERVTRISIKTRSAQSAGVELRLVTRSKKRELRRVDFGFDSQLDSCETVSVYVAHYDGVRKLKGGRHTTLDANWLERPVGRRPVWEYIRKPDCAVLLEVRMDPDKRGALVRAFNEQEQVGETRLAAPGTRAWLALMPFAALGDTVIYVATLGGLLCKILPGLCPTGMY